MSFIKEFPNISLAQITPRKRVAILGGSFNPPTIGHMQVDFLIQMASEILNRSLVNEVWMVPCGQRSDKLIEENDHRMNMLQLSVNEFFEKSEYSVKVYTIYID